MTDQFEVNLPDSESDSSLHSHLIDNLAVYKIQVENHFLSEFGRIQVLLWKPNVIQIPDSLYFTCFPPEKCSQ